MAERPLLIFPEPKVASRATGKPRPIPANYHLPGFERQKDRLTPQFESMLECFISDSTAGIEPEYVLVLETIGKIDDFERAVRAIDGLEWLAEIDSDELEPDIDFYQLLKVRKRFFSDRIDDINQAESKEIWQLMNQNNFIDKNGFITARPIDEFKQHIPAGFANFSEKIIKVLRDGISADKGKAITGRFFLSMSNRRAREELYNLRKSWDCPSKKFKRNYGRWKDIFKQLKSIRPWDTGDRMRDTGVLDYWQEELEIKKGTASKIAFEIELWYRRNDDRRRQAGEEIERLIREEGGKVIATCVMDHIRFHGIKAELPPESIEKALSQDYIKIFNSNDVMFFRPKSQCVADIYPEGELGEFQVGAATGNPVAALLDGCPFENHTLLENRLILDDPEDFERYYEVNKRKHGTAMASLLCHGELDANEQPLTRPVYVRPILMPTIDGDQEHIPDDVFLEDIIERSVRRMFEGDGEGGPVAPTVKVINLSIGDDSKPFFNQLSSAGRLLDWLSDKYRVLFCVSAGNITSDIYLGKSDAEIKALSPDMCTKQTMGKISEEIRGRRILSPADSINALTIGALHADQSGNPDPGKRIDILPSQILPSPISAHGNGFRNSIKPEIYLPGGRQLYNFNQDNTYAVAQSNRAPGQKVATTPVMPGETDRYVYCRGTSNATALATRSAAQIYEVLDELRLINNYDIPDDHIAVLLKTLLIHSASWGDSYEILRHSLGDQSNTRRIDKKTIARYLGFGIPDIPRVLECTARRATSIGSGIIKVDERHEFRLPLPPGLSDFDGMRRLIITLGWLSPVNPDNRKLRKASLSFDPPEDNLKVDRKEVDGRQVKNGTVQHEILEGRKIVSYQDGDTLLIPVICRKDAGTLDEDVVYGLAVTLEISEDIDIPIYEEIKERLRVPIRVQERE
jgi:hypothetical protein